MTPEQYTKQLIDTPLQNNTTAALLIKTQRMLWRIADDELKELLEERIEAAITAIELQEGFRPSRDSIIGRLEQP